MGKQGFHTVLQGWWWYKTSQQDQGQEKQQHLSLYFRP